MSRFDRTIRILALAVGILLAAPGSARAQAPRVSPAAAIPLAREPSGLDLRMSRVDLFELSRYAGWGGTIGAGVGLAYALAFEPGGRQRVAWVIADTAYGFGIGLIAGTAVYVTKLALGR
jgi:hypothetical protein